MPVCLGTLWLGTLPNSEPMMRLADGKYSTMLAAIKFLSLVFSLTALTIGYSMSRKIRVSAPESLIWC